MNSLFSSLRLVPFARRNRTTDGPGTPSEPRGVLVRLPSIEESITTRTQDAGLGELSESLAELLIKEAEAQVHQPRPLNPESYTDAALLVDLTELKIEATRLRGRIEQLSSTMNATGERLDATPGANASAFVPRIAGIGALSVLALLAIAAIYTPSVTSAVTLPLLRAFDVEDPTQALTWAWWISLACSGCLIASLAAAVVLTGGSLAPRSKVILTVAEVIFTISLVLVRGSLALAGLGFSVLELALVMGYAASVFAIGATLRVLREGYLARESIRRKLAREQKELREAKRDLRRLERERIQRLRIVCAREDADWASWLTVRLASATAYANYVVRQLKVIASTSTGGSR